MSKRKLSVLLWTTFVPCLLIVFGGGSQQFCEPPLNGDPIDMLRNLGLVVAGVVLPGLLLCTSQAAGPEDKPRIVLRFHNKPDDIKAATMRFGILLPGGIKKLTFDPLGRTSTVCVKIDGQERLPGFPPGQWQEQEGKLGLNARGTPRVGARSIWFYPNEQVSVTQTVEVVRGEQTFDVDTCRVLYTIENRDQQAHQVGLRFLLDTFIGTNDGAPFIIPGDKLLCETSKVFTGTDRVPEFVQALESMDFLNPGVIAHLKLKMGGKVEPPSGASFGAWPQPGKVPGALGIQTPWKVPVASIRTTKDSAAVLYWDERMMQPNEKRTLGFTYGLGNFSSNAAGDLGVTLAGTFQAGSNITVLALVKNPAIAQTLTLRLTDGLERVGGAETQVVTFPVPNSVRVAPVTWQVRAVRPGTFAVGLASSSGSFHYQGVQINKSVERN